MTTGHLKTQFILIDFENVQPKDLTPLRGRPFMTKVFCGASQTKLPRDLVFAVQSLGSDAEYVPIQGSGPNALDFHIAYYIGRLSAEYPGATFHIISRDTGFDPLIKHLKTQEISCYRWASLNNIPGLASSVPASSSDRVQKVAAKLLSRKDSRPLKRKALATYLKAQLGPQATEAQVRGVMDLLERGGVRILPDDKVAWPQP